MSSRRDSDHVRHGRPRNTPHRAWYVTSHEPSSSVFTSRGSTRATRAAAAMCAGIVARRRACASAGEMLAIVRPGEEAGNDAGAPAPTPDAGCGAGRCSSTRGDPPLPPRSVLNPGAGAGAALAARDDALPDRDPPCVTPRLGSGRKLVGGGGTSRAEYKGRQTGKGNHRAEPPLLTGCPQLSQ